MEPENILSQEIILKLGWTLLHFVWQAAAVALLLGILIALLRKSSANLRYIVACSALGLIILLPVVTMQLVPVSTPQPPANVEPAPLPAVLPVEQVEQTPLTRALEYMEMAQPENVSQAPAAHWKQRASELLESSLPYFVLGWLLGVFGLSLWHLGGWGQLQRLRKKMVKQVDDSIQNRLLRLSEKLHVKQTVQLLESALVQVPTVVGWLRPVILLPASALTGLSSEQLEALLAHELAHIRRYDYLVNMLQTIVETLGFYHPAVWWVSHKIRIERENCCDDLAVSISGDRIRYAKALTSMEEIRAGHSELAVAADGGNLFSRILRLLGKDSTDSSRTSWIPSMITILLIAIIVIPTTLALNSQTENKIDDGLKINEGLIEGRIIDINTGKGMPSMQLTAVPGSSGTSNERFTCISTEDGTFAIGGLQSGEYLLQGDFPSVTVSVVSGRSTNDVLIGIDHRTGEATPKETSAEQQNNGQIIIGTRVIEMPADAMKEVFGPNENFSNGLLVRHGHEIAGRLLTLSQEKKDAKLIVATQILLNNNSNGTIAFIEKEFFIHHYEPIEGEPGKFASQLQPLEIGWKFKFHAKILGDGEKVYIELAAKQQEAGFETRQYRPGHDYQIPVRPEIFATELIAKNSEPVAIGRLKRGETAYCLIATPSVILPEPKPEPLLGKTLPEPGNIQNVDYILKQVEGIPILVCFWDMNQRPSRNFIVELAKRQNELKTKGVTVLAVDTSQEEPATLKEWLDNQNVRFACGNIKGDSKEVLLAWGVQAQPWLILTDEKGIVRAEGFSLEQLDEKFQRKIPDVLIEFWEKSNKSLHKAVANGDIEQVRLLLSKGFDVREKDENGQTALHIAAEYGHKNVAELLVSKGADVNAKGSGDWTAMHSAAVHGYTDLAELLITKGADVNVKDKNGKTPLHFASEGRVDLAELLIEKGANVNAKDNSHGQTPLHTATADVAEILLNKGADINAKNKWGQLPLHCTAGLGSKNVVEFLLANGANVNAVDDSDNTSVHFAAEQGHKAMVELLIAKGAHVNAKNTNTDTPLHKAAYQGHKEVVELLLGLGAALNAKNKWGWTPLHHAVTQGHRDVVEFLIANGADTNAKDNQNRSPLQWAKDIGHKEIIELLQKHKAKNTPEEESTANNSKVPILSKSAAPSGVDKPIVKVDLAVVEVFPDSKMDTETIIVIKNLLGDKITIPDSPDVADLLRKAAGATAEVKDESAGDKRVTQKQFYTLVDMLLSRGYVKILMNPTLEVIDGQTAKISNSQKIPDRQEPLEDLIQITPHVSKDDNIILQVKVILNFKSARKYNEQTTFINTHEIVTSCRLSPGESGIIGGTEQKGLITEPSKEVKELEVPTTEIMVILTPTIVDTTSNRLETRIFQLKYADPDMIKERIEGSYKFPENEPQETIRVIAFPTTKQVTVIASPKNLSRIAEQIAEWDTFQVFKPRIIELQNSDPTQMARLLTTLFAEESGDKVNIRNVILGEDIAGPLSSHFTFENVPETSKIIVMSNFPKAYDAVGQLILELDKKKMTNKDIKQVREWIARLVKEGRLGVPKTLDEVGHEIQNTSEPGTAKNEEWEKLHETAKEYEVIQLYRVGATEAEHRINKALPQILEKESQQIVLVQPIENTGQIIIFGKPDIREKIKKFLAEIDTSAPPSGKLVTRVYHIYDLVLAGARISRGTVDVIMDRSDAIRASHVNINISDEVVANETRNIINLIMQKIDPNSWFENNQNAIGIITPYPAARPRKLAIYQTLHVHQQIQKLLFGHRERIDTTQIKIELRYLYTNVEFLDEVRDSMDIEFTSDTSLDDIQVGTLLRASQKKKDIKSLIAPRATVFNNETARFSIARHTFMSFLDYSKLNNLTQQSQPVPENTFCSITPHIEDNKNIIIDFVQDIPGFRERIIYDRRELVQSYTKATSITNKRIPNNKTFAFTCDIIKSDQDNQTASPAEKKTLIVLIKLTIVMQEEMPGRNVAAMIFNSTRSKGDTAEPVDDAVFLKTGTKEEPVTDSAQILIDTRILTAGDEFLKDIGIDPTLPASSEGWSKYLVHSTGDSAGFVIDQLHTDLILKAAAAHRDIKVLHEPQVFAQNGKKCEINIIESEYYMLKAPAELNALSEQTEPESKRIKLGTTVCLTPTLTPDGRNIELDFEWEDRRLRGITEQIGPNGNVQKLPQIDVVSIKTPCTIPEGQTLFITGPKINYELESESRIPILSELPAVGRLFRSSSKVTETRTTLILITPSTVIKTPPKPQHAESKS